MARMSRVGNASQLDLARERLFHAESAASLALAQRRERAARESLIRALGLWGKQTNALKLPDRLPELPGEPGEIADIERTTVAQRLDIRRARRSLDGLSSSHDLTRATRFINVIEAGPAQVRERGEPTQDGYEVTFEIPIFDWGGAKLARAEALYNQAAHQLRATAIRARSEVRQAYLDYRSAYDLARHYRDEVVPLRKQISDEQLLRYNGMLIGVFELIADAREQVASVSAYLDALREFWLADTALKTAMLTGGSPMNGTPTASLPARAAGGGH
jgi:outer membrane protein TolC